MRSESEKEEHYAIITDDDQTLYLSDIFGATQIDNEYTVGATEHQHGSQYQEYLATAGGFEVSRRRYGTRELTFSGLIVKKKEQIDHIIECCHRIQYLQSINGGISRALIESTSFDWLEGNYLLVGRFSLTIRMLDPFFLSEERILPIQKELDEDTLTLTYPIIDSVHQVDYRLRIVAKNRLFYVPRYSHYSETDSINRLDDHQPDVPSYQRKEKKSAIVAWEEELDLVDVMINSIHVINDKEQGTLDGSIDDPTLLGRIYNIIAIDTKDQSITGQINLGHKENIYRHRTAGSSFNGITANSQLKIMLTGRELERVTVSLVVYHRKSY